MTYLETMESPFVKLSSKAFYPRQTVAVYGLKELQFHYFL